MYQAFDVLVTCSEVTQPPTTLQTISSYNNGFEKITSKHFQPLSPSFGRDLSKQFQNNTSVLLS